jgi:hypothetical protein
VDQVLAGSTPVSHPRIWPCSAADQRGSLRRSRSSVQIRSGPPAGVAQWQSASPVRTKSAFDSRRRLQAGGIRVAEYLTLNQGSASSSLVARTRTRPVSSEGRAPVLQTGSRKLETFTGHQVWARSDNGSTPVLQTGSGDSTSPASTRLSGHNSMAECLVANEDAVGSIPADRSTRRWYIGCASALQAEEADSISARRSRFSGCRVTGSPPALGAGRWRFKSSHPDQVCGKWPSAQGAGFGYRRSRVELPPSRPH